MRISAFPAQAFADYRYLAAVAYTGFFKALETARASQAFIVSSCRHVTVRLLEYRRPLRAGMHGVRGKRD